MSLNSEWAFNQNQGSTWSHRIRKPLLVIVIAVLAISFWVWQRPYDAEPTLSAEPDIQGRFQPQATSVAAFRLTDANGNAFTQENLKGRWSILFFGFTSCPHICPANMTQLTRVYADLQQQHPDMALPQVVFVSVDPQTDKQDRLREFIGHFDPSFQAIGGSDEALAALEQSLSVSHQAGMPKASGFYFVDHSNLLHLVDPEGRLVADFAPPFTQQGLRHDYVRAVRYLKTRL